jgi:hypothetical protein
VTFDCKSALLGAIFEIAPGKALLQSLRSRLERRSYNSLKSRLERRSYNLRDRAWKGALTIRNGRSLFVAPTDARRPLSDGAEARISQVFLISRRGADSGTTLE